MPDREWLPTSGGTVPDRIRVERARIADDEGRSEVGDSAVAWRPARELEDGVMTTEAKPNQKYLFAAAAFVAVGVVAGQVLVGADVTYSPAEGISVFAVLYVLAQGIERVVEIVISAITLLGTDFAENRKQQALASLNSTLNGNPALDDITGAVAQEEKKVEEARLDIGLFAQGLAFALSYALVSYFEFGIFTTIGVDDMAAGVDRVFTALAVMGGAKGLHDLIGKLQKSKEASETGQPAVH
jgi:hypothetical protein